MHKSLCAKLMLVASLTVVFLSFSMTPPELTNNWRSNVTWGCKRTFGALTKAVIENPICAGIGMYYLLFDRETIKDNTFWSGMFGADIAASFVKNLVAPKSHPNNFIVRTVLENPFVTFLAGHMLLYHRDEINQYPIGTMLVGGCLLLNLSINYHAQVKHAQKR